MDKADNLDGYISACQNSPINFLARKLCQYVPWNDQSLAEKIEAGKFGNFGKEVRVVILTPSAEGGMPHTRAPNIICLPAYFPEARLKETIQHELVHIDQRQNPEKWRKRALAEGWVPVLEEDLPAEWVRRCRMNPDTFDARFWAWEGRFVPLPLFVREDKPQLREIVVRWWCLDEKRMRSQAPESFVRKYGDSAARDTSLAEHPYELWAYTNPL